MQHKGEIVEKAIRESGYSITRLAKKLGKSRRWVYQIFEKRNVPINYVIEIGKAINHDFTTEIKELKEYKRSVNVHTWDESEIDFFTEKDKAEYWKNKYLLLLEKYNELLTR